MDKSFWCVKLCAWSQAKCFSLLALGFTHQEGLSYQIFELEDSGLPQQGILPISAKKQQQRPQMFVWKKTVLTVQESISALGLSEQVKALGVTSDLHSMSIQAKKIVNTCV